MLCHVLSTSIVGDAHVHARIGGTWMLPFRHDRWHARAISRIQTGGAAHVHLRSTVRKLPLVLIGSPIAPADAVLPPLDDVAPVPHRRTQ
jgi:hypothetical protein